MINIFIGSHLFTEKTSKTTSAASVIMNSEIVDIHNSSICYTLDFEGIMGYNST